MSETFHETSISEWLKGIFITEGDLLRSIKYIYLVIILFIYSLYTGNSSYIAIVHEYNLYMLTMYIRPAFHKNTSD